jgi:hypothetical protein
VRKTLTGQPNVAFLLHVMGTSQCLELGMRRSRVLKISWLFGEIKLSESHIINTYIGLILRSQDVRQSFATCQDKDS